ncbi:DUF3226 domain-containing protein [Geminocystis herdmanii]|uniref:DUF3226 domain-containing protein n=1 Tax=Geminocystis herdmanii TaxID=669359 RepID=UPI0003463D8D|nr:DUF3226 domain-containing protein [Geminocystis herdmanii]
MIKLTKITQQKLLIGEGKAEEVFFGELINILNLNNEILITSYGGKDNLSNFLETLPLIPGFDELKSLGITRYADNSIHSAFQSVNSILNKHKLPMPKSLDNLIAKNNHIKISLFFLPDNKNSGMLEDLLLNSIENDSIIDCIDSYFECVKNQTGKQPKNMAKAKIHAWLASQKNPDKSLIDATKARYWDYNNFAFYNLQQFILSL